MRHSARNFNRTDRIADQIQKDLALLLQREIKDPRIGMVTINSVSVSKDLAFADVHVTFMGVDGEQEVDEALSVLDHASGYLRSMLAKMIQLRVIPKLRFHYDNTIVEGPRMSRLIDEALGQDKGSANSDDSLPSGDGQQSESQE